MAKQLLGKEVTAALNEKIKGCHQLLLGHISRQQEFFISHAESLTAFCCPSFIGDIVRSFTNADYPKCGLHAPALQLSDLGLDLFI